MSHSGMSPFRSHRVVFFVIMRMDAEVLAEDGIEESCQLRWSRVGECDHALYIILGTDLILQACELQDGRKINALSRGSQFTRLIRIWRECL